MSYRPHPEPDDTGPFCKVCGEQLEADEEPCWQCHGEGGFDAHDEDPINFGPGEEIEMCSECNGIGRPLVCPNAHNHAKVVNTEKPSGK